jgi:hypothetical protein
MKTIRYAIFLTVLLCFPSQGHSLDNTVKELRKLPPTYRLDGTIVIPPWIRERERDLPDNFYNNPKKFEEPLLRRCNAGIQKVRTV